MKRSEMVEFIACYLPDDRGEGYTAEEILTEMETVYTFEWDKEELTETNNENE